MSEEKKQIEKQMAEWDPDKARLMGRLKCDIDLKFDIQEEPVIAELTIEEPKQKEHETMKPKIVSVGKRNKKALF